MTTEPIPAKGRENAVAALVEDVDRACAKARLCLSHEEIAKELRRLAYGWEMAA